MTYRKWLAAFVLLVLSASAGFAQSEQARFAGTVRDQSGALVAGATVSAKNERTGEERTVVTGPTGGYLLAGLRPSPYTLRASRDGFSLLEFTHMELAAGQAMTLDLELLPAGVEENVTVTAAAPLIDISSAKVGVNVSQREVEGLPVNGRQMSQLLLQAPGSQNAGTGTWQDIRFSGRAVEQNVIKYDGVEGSAIIDAAPGNVNGENNTPFKLQASLENVQEFRVESSGYPAEFGTGTGGQVSVVTKSGSNSLRGSVFEYLRNDTFDAPNHFDSVRALDDSITNPGPQSKLDQHQFGGSIGGPVARDRAFFFGSFERYQLNAGKNIIEGVPSDRAWARAVPEIAALRPGFLSPNAVIVPGQSTNPDLDIAQLQDEQRVRESAFSGRLDFKVNDNWSFYTRAFHDQGVNDDPQGVTGRKLHVTANPTNAVFNLQGLMNGGMLINEFKVGYNAAPSTIGAITSPGFEGSLFSLGGTVANSGIAGQSGSSGIASPGGLVRVNSAGNGRAAPYDPFSLSFSDTLSRVSGNHLLKAGADVRLIRMATDQQGGITYTYQNIAGFLANTPQQVQYFGDLSEPSPFHEGATGEKRIVQNYYVGYLQDEWRVRPNLTMNAGLRYDYYQPLRERDNRIVKFNIYTGALDPDTTPFYLSNKANFQPRVSLAWTPRESTAIKGGFGIFVGPGQTEDQIQPIEAERISTTVTSGALNKYPVNPDLIRANFTGNPNNRSYQPRAYDDNYELPERVYQYTVSFQQELGRHAAASIAYVGSQGRNLFLRSVANRTVGVLQTSTTSSASNIREFDIVTCSDGRVLNGLVTPITPTVCGPGATAASKQSPYAEIDYKTSGGHDDYNAMQLALTKRSANGLTTNMQYTLGRSRGNTGGSNEAVAASNNARELSAFDFDNGYNNFDVRHTFNLSLLYALPGRGALRGGWSLGGIVNARSGLPVPVLITRPDIVYVDGAGNVWNNAAAGRTAVVNVPGGGASRSTRRPDVVPGVDPFVENGGRIFLNPAAFTTPKPGTFGNLERNSIHGPNFRQVDFVLAKRLGLGNSSNAEFRWEVFNVFNHTNFANPPATLPNALPGSGESSTQANRVQPGQPFSSASAGSFGQLSSTVGTTVGLGTNRQMQIGFRLSF